MYFQCFHNRLGNQYDKDTTRKLLTILYDKHYTKILFKTKLVMVLKKMWNVCMWNSYLAYNFKHVSKKKKI